MTRKAVLDIGSLKMKVAHFDVEGRTLLKSNSHLTLLGKDLSDTHMIAEESLDRLRTALELVCNDLEEDGVDDVVIIGTEALRTARNVDGVHRLIEQFFPQHKLEIIDQDREADLFFTAVGKNFPNQEIVCMDIGGGSVQLVKGRYDTDTRSASIDSQYNLATGTYRLQQRYSPENDVVSMHLNEARKHIQNEYEHVDSTAGVMIFGSSIMLDFILATGIEVEREDAISGHPVHVSIESLEKLLDELSVLAPSRRVHLYPEGEYFMYGADYLLMNLISAAKKMQVDKIYPTNLNTSYAFI